MLPSFRRFAMLRLARVFDLAVVCFTFLGALAISSGSFTWPSFTDVLAMRIKLVNLFFSIGYLTLCAAIFSSCSFYLSHRLSYGSRQIREIFLAVILIAVTLLVLRWPLQLGFATNRFLVVFWVLTFTTLMLSHRVGQQVLYFARSHGRNLRNVIVVGEGLDAAALADRITKEAALGYRVLRIIDAKEIQKNG